MIRRLEKVLKLRKIKGKRKDAFNKKNPLISKKLEF